MLHKYIVTVAEGYRWPRVRIAGREFVRDEAVTLAEHEMNAEIGRAASEEYGILEIEVVEAPADVPEIDATDAAWALAVLEEVDLAEVDGSGQSGRIVKRDVEVYLAAMAAVAAEDEALAAMAAEVLD